MATLYLTEPGSRLRLEGGRLRVEKEDRVLHDLPREVVDDVVLAGGTQVTTQAMRDLLARGAPLHLLTTHGTYLGRLEPAASGNTEVLRAQVRRSDDPAFALELARTLVLGKLANTRAVLLRLARRRGEPELLAALEAHRLALEQARAAPDLDYLRGTEGAAAQGYFAALAALLPPEWGFGGRGRRPPPDPVNAMLSFGYALLLTRVLSGLQRAGLHPGMGFLHASHGQRPALALDLMEEHRAPLVDRLVLGLVSKRRLAPGQFTRAEGGVWLGPEGRRLFIRAFEERLSEGGYRGLFARQARLLADHLRGGEPYRPVRVR